MAEIKIDSWSGCYPSQWKGVIVPQAMSHPAKFSSKLIRRIYDHMIDEGWLRIGDRVIDPFGGVALGALEAMRHGLIWQGIELEAKFVEMGGQNIDLWNKKFSRMPHWGRAQLTQGDSRFILKVLAGTQQGVVSSPPYAGTELSYKKNGLKVEGKDHYERPYMDGQDDDYGSTPGQLGAMQPGGFSAAITSPPFRQSEGGTPEPKPGGAINEQLYARHAAGNSAADGYGTTPGNLANMDEPGGDFNAVIASPPFGEAMTGGGIAKKGYQNEELRKGTEEKPFDLIGKRSYMPDNQGQTPGQLANLPAGDFEGAVSSPPFGDTQGFHDKDFSDQWDPKQSRNTDPSGYGDAEGNIGNDSGETFWQAARQIVEQVYLALLPGGHAVWVVKDYIKSKSVIPFCDQWRQLCESVGFVTLHEHHAMLTKKKTTKINLDGEHVHDTIKYVSFFRRLAEKKGSPEINYEVVLCMQKPENVNVEKNLRGTTDQ